MEAKDFIINVGPNGTFRPSGSYQTLPEHIDAIFERYETDKVKNITIYFHGGLVNEKSGMETAFKMGKHISDTGQTPLCFVWETGLIETVSSNLTKISDTKLFNKLVKVLVKKLSEKLGFDLTEGKGAGQLLTDEEIDKELFKPIPFESYNQEKLIVNGKGAEAITMLPKNEADLIRSLEADFTYLIQADLDFTNTIANTKLSVDTGQQGQAKGIISTATFIKHVALIAFRVIKRFIEKRDHDFYPTTIEEILRELYVAELGAWVWNNMKLKSNDMWKDNQKLSGLNRFAGRYLLDNLIDYAKRNNDVKVNLIGHSAGSIAICNLLNASSSIYPELKYNSIIFMAPACRIDLFNKEIVLNKSRFEKFRMFTMNNQFETRDCLVPYFYVYSLLYLISGILEDEGKGFDEYILGLERHIKGLSPYNLDQELVSTKEFLYESGKSRVIFSQSIEGELDGLRTKSISHGGFDDDEETIESLKYFLNEA
ncbi:hypothetical protein OA88_20495 [Flavobacterium sp. JRM]|nr:hypothetical protein OA88_20495 [Flavobacterium sp. JRM]